MKIHLRPHEYMRMRTKGEGWIYEDRPLATFSSRPSPALESLEGPAAESGEFNWDKKKRERKTWKSKVVNPADAQPARRGEIEESPFAIFVDLV